MDQARNKYLRVYGIDGKRKEVSGKTYVLLLAQRSKCEGKIQLSFTENEDRTEVTSNQFQKDSDVNGI